VRETAAESRVAPKQIGVPAHDQAITVVLDFVHPFRPRRQLVSERRDEGVESARKVSRMGEGVISWEDCTVSTARV
jgi:hypothetical protein